jgi:16S rRNA (cytosine1402-N4)-methyltransferase
MSDYHHIPVLLNEVLEYLDPKQNENFIDATLGGGGYSRAILSKIAKGKLLSVDLDKDAIENSNKQIEKLGNWEIAQGNFSHIDKIVKNHNFPAPDGIVADLGLSSYELDQAGRGISFKNKEPLDMRFDQHGDTVDAKFILNNYEERQILQIFEDYGEEKFSRQIVRKLLEARGKSQVHYTTELMEIIESALPKPIKHKAEDSARRIFQALRIEVNHELSNLQEFLPKAFDLLKPGGRLVVVSFHSLEDRIVKQFFVSLTKGCVCPPDFPQCLCGKLPEGKILTKKLVTATEQELEQNSRSKPAKLRAVLKL